jgi:hypothetical protein
VLMDAPPRGPTESLLLHRGQLRVNVRSSGTFSSGKLNFPLQFSHVMFMIASRCASLHVIFVPVIDLK